MESDLSEVVHLYALEQKAENKRRVGKMKEIRLENSFGRGIYLNNMYGRYKRVCVCV